MNTDFPIPITDENDLEYYENYLKQEFSSTQNSKSLLSEKLKNYIGKLLKIDIINNGKPDVCIGVLLQTGEDYIIIKTSQNREIIIPLVSIKLLTVLQNNTKPPHF